MLKFTCSLFFPCLLKIVYNNYDFKAGFLSLNTDVFLLFTLEIFLYNKIALLLSVGYWTRRPTRTCDRTT